MTVARRTIPHLHIIVLVVVFISTLSSGCASLKNKFKKTKAVKDTTAVMHSEFQLHPREKQANRYLAEGAYPEARIQWKILVTLDPTNPVYLKKLQETESLIAKQADKHLRSAVTALDAGKTEQARIELLKSLSYDPSQSLPKRYLQEIEYRAIHKVQLAKYERIKQQRTQLASEKPSSTSALELASSNGQEFHYLEQGIRLFRDGKLRQSITEINKFLNSYPGDPLAMQYLSDAHMGIAMRLLSTKDRIAALNHFEQANSYSTGDDPKPKAYIRQTKKMIADDFYEKGQRIFRKDTDKAIEFWELSIKYNPQHTNAQMRLRMAQKIKQKLNSLQDL